MFLTIFCRNFYTHRRIKRIETISKCHALFHRFFLIFILQSISWELFRISCWIFMATVTNNVYFETIILRKISSELEFLFGFCYSFSPFCQSDFTIWMNIHFEAIILHKKISGMIFSVRIKTMKIGFASFPLSSRVVITITNNSDLLSGTLCGLDIYFLR